ncbi:hypothetical protein MPSI1_002623 [Malassezia psittaci]|uniref:Phosphoglycerate mutase-like protein n=1 Tax=Malassezia psittaci TaxID=1821823 RepID=A0AAF0FG11_9BASI|nr:hypothetical protein MPSI1_002623 [Malassezia psittaci]
MGLEKVYVARHAFRMAISHFNHDAQVARDPPLTAHGDAQARHLADFFASMPADERPELVISSPYSRCITTALPTVERLGVELVVEPGLAEWFPPVWPEDTGLHPSPRRAEHVQPYYPTVSTRWTPLLYPDPRGETVQDVHQRVFECFRRIEIRLNDWKVKRVLLVSHAASIIALGRMLLSDGDYSIAAQPIKAPTASVSKYQRDTTRKWIQIYNGNTTFLPDGPEREWDFSYVPENNTEPGMGHEWHDSYRPAEDQLIYSARSRL